MESVYVVHGAVNGTIGEIYSRLWMTKHKLQMIVISAASKRNSSFIPGILHLAVSVQMAK